MKGSLPERTRAYRSYIFNSQNWDLLTPRPDDIVISTSYKSGTTWLQNIVLQLVFLGQPKPALSAISPWLDRQSPTIEEEIKKLDAQQHRRFLKSHLPLDALPYFPEVKYIVGARDTRDVFMSFWNHYSNYTDANYALLNGPADRVGPPLPRCPEDIHDFWRTWISRGWFAWESEGYPQSGNMYHTQSWWNFRALDNVLLVHFDDLLNHLPEEIRRIATYLEINLSEGELATIAHDVSFSSIKKNASMTSPMPVEFVRDNWSQGLDTFFFKGTNGRWKGVLTEEELAMYERAKARVLTTDCAAYLEQGRAALR